jgi:hypothetical protein
MPLTLKDERRTSNVQRRMKNEYPIPNIQRLFLFLFSRFDTRNEKRAWELRPNWNLGILAKIQASTTLCKFNEL